MVYTFYLIYTRVSQPVVPIRAVFLKLVRRRTQFRFLYCNKIECKRSWFNNIAQIALDDKDTEWVVYVVLFTNFTPRLQLEGGGGDRTNQKNNNIDFGPRLSGR